MHKGIWREAGPKVGDSVYSTLKKSQGKGQHKIKRRGPTQALQSYNQFSTATKKHSAMSNPLTAAVTFWLLEENLSPFLCALKGEVPNH